MYECVTTYDIIMTSLQVIYSRVARVCKNDRGQVDPDNPQTTPVLTTYLKARMACRASSDSTIDYYYNDLREWLSILYVCMYVCMYEFMYVYVCM